MTNISFTTSSGKKVRFRARHQRRHIRRTRYGVVVAGKGKSKRFIATNRLGETFLYEERDGTVQTIKFLGWKSPTGKLIPPRG